MRTVAVVFLAIIVLLISGCTGSLLVRYVEEKSEPPFISISADAVNPAYEGCRVQLKARAYTDEWLELQDIGVRCQALCLSMQTERKGWNHVRCGWDYDDYRGLPLRSKLTFAQRVRMGAYELHFHEDELEYSVPFTKMSAELLHLPESWRPYAREIADDDSQLKIELAGNPPRTIVCDMVENGYELVVRGVQRGNKIFPILGVRESEQTWQMLDRMHNEFLLEKIVLPACVSLAIPALLLGIFRVLKWRPQQKKDELAMLMMLVLVAGAFLLFGGWRMEIWAGVAVLILVLGLWGIVRVIRGFGVDSVSE
jgi:hypothetical protein